MTGKDKMWLIPLSVHLTSLVSSSASDWSSLPTYAACKSAPSFFAKQSTSRDVQSKALNLTASLAKRIAYIYQRLSQWIANCNVVTCEEKGAISFEGIPGDHVFSVDIVWKRAYFVEGSSGVEVCIIVKSTGVESVKGMFLANSSK